MTERAFLPFGDSELDEIFQLHQWCFLRLRGLHGQ
jgi:hypothetical protein